MRASSSSGRPRLASSAADTIYTDSEDIGGPAKAPSRSLQTAPEAAAETTRTSAVGRARGRRALPKAGDRVGRFAVLERLGEGGMGVVFTAYDSVLDRRVALKLVHERRADPSWQARILREAQALARLSHPNVVQIYEAGAYDEQIYLAMEFIKGSTLRARLRRERARRGGATPTTEAEVRVVLELFIAAGSGLFAAHQAGLVHRDFKPDNVLVSEEGRACVVDFGLVALTSRDVPTELIEETTRDGVRALDLELTEAGAIMGTLAYMSPEQLRGYPADALSDQFSFSIALFEALHGARPFSGSSRAQLRANVAEGRRAEVRRNRAVPGWIQEAVERGLAVDPRARWPSMAALLEALRRSPTRRRRRLIGGLLLAAAAVAAPLSYGAAEERREAACARLAAAAVAPWTEHRPEIRAGLIASGAAFAPPTAAWVERQLDAWTAAWQDARVEACVDPGEPGSYEARRGLCLDRQAARMRSLLPLLLDADQTTLQHAAVAAASLPEVSRCVDPVWLSTELRAAPSPATQAGIEALRARLLAATSHEITGSLGRGLEIAEAALKDARELGDPEVLAEALLTAGRLRLEVVAPEDAAELLADAYFLAGEIGHQRVSAEAAVQMISAVGFHLAHTAEGLAWGRHALMWLEHLGIRDAMINADYHNHIGITLVRSGPQAGTEALEHFRAALAILVDALGDAHPLVAGAHNNVGYALDAMERRDEALHHYRRAVAITAELFGPEHPDVATGRTNIASVHLYAGDHARALAELERALAVRRATLGPDHLDVADSLGNIGFALRQLGRHEEALERFRESLRIRESQLDPGHPDIALSLQSIGATLIDAGAPAAALAPLERALAIREAIEGADHPSAGESHQTLALALIDLGRPDAAVDHLERALAILAATFSADHPSLVEALLPLAAANAAAGRWTDAEAALHRAAAIVEANAPEAALHRAAAIVEANAPEAALDLAAAELDLADGITEHAPALRPRALALARRALARLGDADAPELRHRAAATLIKNGGEPPPTGDPPPPRTDANPP